MFPLGNCEAMPFTHMRQLILKMYTPHIRRVVIRLSRRRMFYHSFVHDGSPHKRPPNSVVHNLEIKPQAAAAVHEKVARAVINSGRRNLILWSVVSSRSPRVTHFAMAGPRTNVCMAGPHTNRRKSPKIRASGRPPRVTHITTERGIKLRRPILTQARAARCEGPVQLDCTVGGNMSDPRRPA